jgi:hypothetical protein
MSFSSPSDLSRFCVISGLPDDTNVQDFCDFFRLSTGQALPIKIATKSGRFLLEFQSDISPVLGLVYKGVHLKIAQLKPDDLFPTPVSIEQFMRWYVHCSDRPVDESKQPQEAESKNEEESKHAESTMEEDDAPALWLVLLRHDKSDGGPGVVTELFVKMDEAMEFRRKWLIWMVDNRLKGVPANWVVDDVEHNIALLGDMFAELYTYHGSHEVKAIENK